MSAIKPDTPQPAALVERLRLVAAWLKPGGPMPTTACPQKYPAISEAAALIEAQQARIEALAGALGEIDTDASIHSSTIARSVTITARAALAKLNGENSHG